MEIHAYNQDYLNDAQGLLGEAFDFGIVTLGISPKDFGSYFTTSDASKQIERGNIKYIAGMNGCELTRLILEENGIHNETPDAIYIDRSPEYWSGWILGFYQWYTTRRFADMLHLVPLDEILSMYPVFHEMDVMQFVDAMDKKISERTHETRLSMYRNNMGYSQSELAKAADVPVRQIQLFEQKQRNINKTAALTLYKLSRALYCNVEDLMEI